MHEPYYSEPPQFFERSVGPWEEELAAALQEIFSAGTHDLDGMVAGLNQKGVKPPDRDTWTVEGFRSVLKQVGG